MARFGGDEFGILLEDIDGEHDAIEMAQRIAGVFTRPFVLDGNEHFVTTSIGIALAEGGELAEDLLRDADAAMHRAKERGRARYELFDEAMRGRAISRLRVENDLRRALERDELPSLPAAGLAARPFDPRRRGAHPLGAPRARADPPRGLHPGRRGERADRADRPLGARARLPPGGRAGIAQRPDAAPLTMSVNLSAAQVANRGLAETVATALRVSGLDPSCLALELTESMLVGDNEELSPRRWRRSRRSACGWCSTTSGPATRRCPT